MNDETHQETLQAIYRMLTDVRSDQAALRESSANTASELRFMRERLQKLEQGQEALTEALHTSNRRLDSFAERLERIERKLDRIPA